MRKMNPIFYYFLNFLPDTQPPGPDIIKLDEKEKNSLIIINILCLSSLIQIVPAIISYVKGYSSSNNRVPSLIAYIVILFIIKQVIIQLSINFENFNYIPWYIACFVLNPIIQYVSLVFLFLHLFCGHYQRHMIVIVYGHNGLRYNEKRTFISMCGYPMVVVIITSIISYESYFNQSCYFNNTIIYSLIILYLLIVPICCYFYCSIFLVLKNITADKIKRMQDVVRYLEQFRLYFMYFISFMLNVIFYTFSMSFDLNSQFYFIFDFLSFTILMILNYFVFSTNQLITRYFIKTE